VLESLQKYDRLHPENPMAVENFYLRGNCLTNHSAIDNILGGQKKLLYDSIDFQYFGQNVILSKTIMEDTPV
jgi:hypothetical protein